MDTNKNREKNLLGAEDLDNVIGGADVGNTKNGLETKEMYCDSPECKTKRLFYLGSGGRAVCSVCHKQKIH